VSAIAVQPCSVLHPTEIAATLRVPGVIVFFGSKDDQEHLHICFLTRISKAGSFEENLKRYQSETPPTLIVTIIDGIRKGDFPLLKAEANTTNVELPMLGDRAVLRRSPGAEKLMVASGSNLLVLGYSGIDAKEARAGATDPRTRGDKHQLHRRGNHQASGGGACSCQWRCI